MTNVPGIQSKLLFHNAAVFNMTLSNFLCVYLIWIFIVKSHLLIV